ncbi:hypothetical protein FZ983_23390 [Azospirillum sp. B21]|nr:hypothetical protein FZ983_23390 [Azospirillum sp. B21]
MPRQRVFRSYEHHRHHANANYRPGALRASESCRLRVHWSCGECGVSLHPVVPGTLNPVHDKSNRLTAVAAPQSGVRLGERMCGSARIIHPVR